MEKNLIVTLIVGILIGILISASFGLSLELLKTNESKETTENQEWQFRFINPDGTIAMQGTNMPVVVPLIELDDPIAVPYTPPIMEISELEDIEMPTTIIASYNSNTDSAIISNITGSLKCVDANGIFWLPVSFLTTEGTGQINYIDLEGGFYGIISDSGEKFDPINLADEFKIDGLLVNYQLKIRNDLSNFRMWGTIVEVIEINQIT